jgi:hypothetical protein
MLTMSTGTTRAVLDFDDATPTCWKYQITSHCAKAKAENTIWKDISSHNQVVEKFKICEYIYIYSTWKV